MEQRKGVKTMRSFILNIEAEVTERARQLSEYNRQHGLRDDPTTNLGNARIQLGVDQRDIATRAYLKWLKRDRLGLCGTAEGDWLEAEAELHRNRQLGFLTSRISAA